MQISRLVLAYAFTISIVMSAFHGSVAKASGSSATSATTQQQARSYSDYQQEISDKKQMEAAQKQADDAKKAIETARANAMNARASSINDAAKKQKQQSVVGTTVGLGMAAFCAYQATQTCNNWATAGYCALSVSGTVLSLAAVSMAMKSGKQSVASMEDLTVPDVNAASGATPTTVPGSGDKTNPSDVLNAILGNPLAPNSVKKNAAQVKAALDDLSKKGIKVDLDKQTVTTPDGKVTPVSSLIGGAGGGAGSGGKGSADFAAMMAGAKEAGEKAAKAADVTEGWESGGAMAAGGSGSNGAGSGLPTFNPMAGFNAKAANFGREPAAFAGSTSEYNGDALLPADANMWVQMNLRHEWLGQRGKVNPDLAPPSPQQ